MADDAGGTAHEPKRVSTAEPWERAYWARRLMVPVEQVVAAVEAVGEEPARVAAHLGRDWPGHEPITLDGSCPARTESRVFCVGRREGFGPPCATAPKTLT